MRNEFEAAPRFSISQQDWSLQRKGPADATRHNEKVKEAIRDNLPDIIADEAIITSDGQKVVKVPIKSLQLPRFRYDFGRNKHIGQGEGNSQPGDSIGKKGQGRGQQAGDQPGVDYYEAEITIDELAEMIFQDLGLPNLKPKKREELGADAIVYDTIRKKGPFSALDRKRTLLDNMKRNAIRTGRPFFGKVKDGDLRFRSWNPTTEPKNNAVIFAMRDVSGSMGEFEKYITRSAYFWMLRFLRTKYQNVNIVFITHHTEAKEVDEETFFKLGESGGTKVSSAYQLALDTVKSRYSPQEWNIYSFHFSDGDNWGMVDNQLCVRLIQQLLEAGNLFGYGEIKKGSFQSESSLYNVYSREIKDPRFVTAVLTGKQDIASAIKKFFPKELNPEGTVSRA